MMLKTKLKELYKYLRKYIKVPLRLRIMRAFLLAMMQRPKYRRHIFRKVGRFIGIYLNPLYLITWLVEDSWFQVAAAATTLWTRTIPYYYELFFRVLQTFV